MTPSSFSRTSTASTAVPSSVHPSIAAQHRPTDHRRRDDSDISRRRNDATNSRPTHLDPTGLPSSTTASSQPRTRPARTRPTSQSSSTANAIDVLMPLLQALFSILQPSEGLLSAVDVIRRQVADALHATNATCTDTSAQPTVSWWCPCCRCRHKHACCSALARVSPCKHCGDGHSNRSCSLRREQASARALEAQLAASQLPANRSIAFGTFGAVPIHLSAPQSTSEMSEVAQVERTASFQATAPSTRAATPQPPAADQVAQFPVIILARGGDIASPGVDPESPTTASTDSNSSSVKAKGERNGKQGERRSAVSASAQTDSVSLAAPVPTKHAKDPTTADVPVTSSVGNQGAFDCVITTAAQRRARRQPGDPVLQVDLFPLGKGHQGCCSMRQCGKSFFGQEVCYITTLDPRSFNPFKGYYLCDECRNGSDVYKRLFPHPVLLHEPPDVLPKVDSVSSAYLTGPRYAGLCAEPECGQPLTTDDTDEVFVVDTDPRSQNPWRNVTICKTCRNSSNKNKHMFSRGIVVSSQHVHDYRENYRVRTSPHQALREWELPDIWAPKHPGSLQAAQQKCDAQFAWNFGCRVLNASLSGKSVLTVQQAQEHFRTKLLAFCERNQKPHKTVEAYLSYLSNTSMQAALPTLLSTGFTDVLFATAAYAGGQTTHTYHCAQCRGEVSMTDAVQHAAESDLQFYLLCQHARQNPLCNFFEQLKRESILPELFFPDTRQRSSEHKVQAALLDRVSRRTKFMKSLQEQPEFSVVPPSGDPTVQVFNPWTNT